MPDSLLRIGDPEPRYTARGSLSSFSIQMWHDGLNEHRELKSSDPGVLGSKVEAVAMKWEEKWQAKQRRLELASNAESAAFETLEAQTRLEECERLLQATLAVDDRVDWESLKRHSPFVWKGEQLPFIKYRATSNEPISVQPTKKPSPPKQADFQPALKWYHSIFRAARDRLVERANIQFESALRAHQKRMAELEAEDEERASALVNQKREFKVAEADYLEECTAANAKVDSLRLSIGARDPDAVCEHANLVLGNSKYPDWHKADYVVEYNTQSGMMVVDYRLPSPDEIPTLERVSYIKSRDERVEKHISDAKKARLFDSICYQIALRTIHELFEADDANALEAITFNGWVEAVNPATGIVERGCILSVQALKAEFMAFDLSRVDPNACFKALKGVAASSLSGLAPVRPILKLETNDKRFVESHDVASGLDDSVNLASMPWEDFEHLVRQLFSQVFSSPGAEVHVTQASRDGGVDAIALDPDPIKDGKVVIQRSGTRGQ